MTFAFPALVLVVIAWPGIFARGVATAFLPRKVHNIGERVFDSLALAAALHLALLAVVRVIDRLVPGLVPQIDVTALAGYLMGRGTPTELNANLDLVAVYLAVQTLAALGCGLWMRSQLMRNTTIGRFFNWALQIQLEWLWLWQQPDTVVYLSTVVNTEDGAFIYDGIVADVFWNRQGEIDAVLLFDALRRPLTRDRSPANPDQTGARFYPIRGDRLLIKYQQMITINFNYMRLTPAEP